MSDATPAIRAHYLKLALKRLRAYPDGKGQKIRDRIAAAALIEIREASSLSWLPLALVIDVCDTILAVLGDAEARQFWTDLMRDSYDHGLLKPLTMLAQFGLGQGGVVKLLRMAPRAWSLSTRNCGTIDCGDKGPHGGLHLRGIDLLPQILESRGFICVFYGACQAMLELFKSPGRVSLDPTWVPGDGAQQIAFEIVL